MSEEQLEFDFNPKKIAYWVNSEVRDGLKGKRIHQGGYWKDIIPFLYRRGYRYINHEGTTRSFREFIENEIYATQARKENLEALEAIEKEMKCNS